MLSLASSALLALLGLVATACTRELEASGPPRASTLGSPEDGAPQERESLLGPPLLRAEQSTSSPILEDPAQACLSERGCPFQPAEVPSCSSLPVATPLPEALSRPDGTRVTVAGQLVVMPAQTLLECGGGACCNRASGEITLHSNGVRAPLRDARHPDAFRCYGDDSRVCCGILLVRDEAREQPGAPSTLTLVSAVVRRDERGVTFLDQPGLCRP